MEWLWKIFVTVLILAILAGLTALLLSPQKPFQIEVTPGTENSKRQFSIYGAVMTPGTYEYNGHIRIEDAVAMAGGYTEKADLPAANPAKWIEDGETLIIPTMGAQSATITPLIPDEQKINLNTADKAELMSLPGIGEKRAGDIIELREKSGSFRSVEEILQIQGISERLLESIYDRIFVQ